MLTIATFINPFEAHVARGKIEAAGIHAVVIDDRTAQVNWLYTAAIGDVKVQVTDEDADRAREILLADDELYDGFCAEE